MVIDGSLGEGVEDTEKLLANQHSSALLPFHEQQLNEQKKQVEYFKNLYEEEKSERIRANAQYQTYLLGTAEDNKRHWWQFWNKTNKERDN